MFSLTLIAETLLWEDGLPMWGLLWSPHQVRWNRQIILHRLKVQVK
jgi:hypothetical protein